MLAIPKTPITFLLMGLSFMLSLPIYALDNAGKTIVARGQVNAKNPEAERLLKRRAPVFTQDEVTTAVNSSTQLRMVDGGLLSLQPESELKIANYEFNAATQNGKVEMNLLKGGLRTITGVLKSSNNSYKVTTPVASIGVRGTHYEAEILGADLILAVWEGNIDVQVLVGASPISFSLGENEDFRFAIIKADGNVDFLLSIPTQLAKGHSTEFGAKPIATKPKLTPVTEEVQIQPLVKNTVITHDNINISNPEFEASGESTIDNDTLWSSLSPADPDIISERTGSFSFNNILAHNITSNLGAISNLSLSMTLNFETLRVPTGQLSFDDQAGQWFAVFNGVINAEKLELDINFAAHNNNLAEGVINALLLNNGEQILGDFQLHEVGDSENQAGGDFLLGEQP